MSSYYLNTRRDAVRRVGFREVALARTSDLSAMLLTGFNPKVKTVRVINFICCYSLGQFYYGPRLELLKLMAKLGFYDFVEFSQCIDRYSLYNWPTHINGNKVKKSWEKAGQKLVATTMLPLGPSFRSLHSPLNLGDSLFCDYSHEGDTIKEQERWSNCVKSLYQFKTWLGAKPTHWFRKHYSHEYQSMTCSDIGYESILEFPLWILS
jgi:hypothetical protein